MNVITAEKNLRGNGLLSNSENAAPRWNLLAIPMAVFWVFALCVGFPFALMLSWRWASDDECQSRDNVHEEMLR